MREINVIFVDDEPMICEIFEESLAKSGVNIKTFTNPNEALIFAHDSPPDLMFIDYRMQGLNGDQLAELLPSAIPKYLVTGEISTAPKYAFKGILRKPFELSEIEKIIEDTIKTLF